jgi:sugar phosphate isomerase/epimerase
MLMPTLAIGVLVDITDNRESFRKLRELGATTCQLQSWQPAKITEELAKGARSAAAAEGVKVTSYWSGYSGPSAWNFKEGPATIGLVPAEYRAQRVIDLKKGADIAGWLGVPNMVTHVGFLPVDPKHPDYLGAVAAMTEIADYCGARGLYFCFETGQETPVTLLRCIQDIGRPNLGVNLDPANLLMYGNGNPIDALDLIGKYVRDVHAKDGEYPTDGHELGVEKPLGEGRVNFPGLIAKLKSLGYSGSLTIEREISGPQQIEDIKHAIKVLTPLL